MNSTHSSTYSADLVQPSTVNLVAEHSPAVHISFASSERTLATWKSIFSCPKDWPSNHPHSSIANRSFMGCDLAWRLGFLLIIKPCPLSSSETPARPDLTVRSWRSWHSACCREKLPRRS